MALVLYPHLVTGVFSASNRLAISRNAAFLPTYSFLLALIALLGFMAIADGVDKMAEQHLGLNSTALNFAVPALILAMFSSWFAGVAFAAIAIGALVFILGLPLRYAIQLQLLGGVWIIQTLPVVIGGLYTRWFHDRALVLGWFAGIVVCTAMAASQSFRPIYSLQIAGWTIPTYAAFASLILNLVVVIASMPVFNAIRAVRGADERRRSNSTCDRSALSLKPGAGASRSPLGGRLDGLPRPAASSRPRG